jgi:hypothetical protein
VSDPRREAESLVVAGLAALAMAARGATGYATGSPACCVCPVCKAIDAARDPDPAFADRLSSAAGDVAAGLAGVLRSFSSTNQPGSRHATASDPGAGPAFGAGAAHPGTDESDAAAGDVWRQATRGSGSP